MINQNIISFVQPRAEHDEDPEEDLELTQNDGFMEPPAEVLEEVLRSRNQIPK